MSKVETLVTRVKQGSWYNGYSAIACHAREFFSADCVQILFIEYIKKNTLIIANYATTLNYCSAYGFVDEHPSFHTCGFLHPL